MADAKGETPETSQDLTIFVQNLLEQMVPILPHPSPHPFSQQNRFNQMSTTIIGRSKLSPLVPLILFLVDEMGSRIDDLERSIAELMEQVQSHSLSIPSLPPHLPIPPHCPSLPPTTDLNLLGP